MRPFVMSIACSQTELPALREQLGQWLTSQAIQPEPAFHTKLVIHEAAKNAIAHADPSDEVKVRVAIEEDDILIEVLDTNGVPWELDGANGAEIRGLTLIHALTRHVETVAQPDGTALVMLVGRD